MIPENYQRAWPWPSVYLWHPGGRRLWPVNMLQLHDALIGAIDVIFHQAEECRRVTGVDATDPAVVEAHSCAVEFMLLGSPPDSPSGETKK